MKKLGYQNLKFVNSFEMMAKCRCGNCTCRYCNVLVANPHEAEVGSNSISAMVKGGYWK